MSEALRFVIPETWGLLVADTVESSGSVRLVIGALTANLLWVIAGWRSWARMGWPGFGPGPRLFFRGLALGLGMAAAALIPAVVFGLADLSIEPGPFSAYLGSAAILVGILSIAALAEELLFRGFPLSRLADAMGPGRASLLLALGFAVLHGYNPGVTALGLVNIAVASLALSAIFFRLGGMPAAWGAHLGWNAGLGLVDAPVSGIIFQLPVLEYAPEGPNWVAGGSFGPEGGVIGTVVMAAVAVWLGRDLFTLDRAATGPSEMAGQGRAGEAG